MKGFHSARSASVLAAAYLAAHLPFLAPSLEDIDSINFALGLREFDVGRHQPHPPGYPLYIGLGRLSLAAIGAVAPALETIRAEALALAVWSALGGAAAIVAAWTLFAALDSSRRTALWGAALLAVAPLFWIAGLRPMSDLPGLALALSAQALVVRGMSDRPSLLAGAFLAGVSGGIRVQMIALTLPLLVFVAVRRRDAGTPPGAGGWLLTRAAAAFLAGMAAWVVPLVVASGGVDGYLRALASQAGEDFAWVDMLWANPTPRRLALSLHETLILPWSAVPLAIAVSAAAAGGAVHAFVRDRGRLLVPAVAFGPYVLFHLLFQETFTVRYALPVLPVMSWLAARGLSHSGAPGAAVAAALTVWAALVAVPGGIAYGREAHPAFRAIADMEQQARDAGPGPGAARPAAIYSHYSVRRPLQARAPRGVAVIEPPIQGEWLGMIDYWLRGGTGPVWFLADPRRTDLDSLDPHARRPTRYRWSVGERLELTGTRPLGVDWYRFDPPGWVAGNGWSLTPETAGVTRSLGTGLDRGPIEAYVRRGRGPMHLAVGGGYVDFREGTRQGAVDPVVFEMSIDRVPVATWTLEPGGAGRFLRFVDLPGGVPADSASRYATLVIAAHAAARDAPTPAVAIRQFDIQPAGTPIFAFGDGWHDEEYDNVTGRRWRWTSDRSVIRISPPRAVRLTLRGESPARYFDELPEVRVTAGGRTIGTRRPDEDFEWELLVPAEELAAAGGAVAIETDRVYLPAEAEGTADARRLGLRLFAIEVHPVSP